MIQETELQPEKAYVFLTDGVEFGASIFPDKYYQFSYENGNLKSVIGRLSSNNQFVPNVTTLLSYSPNKVVVDYMESMGSYTTISYSMENNRPKKAEQYFNGDTSYLFFSKTYSYEQDKIKIYTKRGSIEYYTTYYFDTKNNLIKKEVLEKTGGMDNKFTTTAYSDFDNAKNPFKKLYLINDDFYEKSLSANNFRAKESVSQYLPNPANGNMTYPPGHSSSQWTYHYDANGQVLLYFPLPVQ
ncbi:hypothetical protein ABXT08_20135 [Chryseobacterium sp. NRRL B-14859]|uniref:hypothetical protein n=1 Tax=Chryseobacterium sp. NRRL B-14859 TaxID=1562763 RepID=UPI003399EE8A